MQTWFDPETIRNSAVCTMDERRISDLWKDGEHTNIAFVLLRAQNAARITNTTWTRTLPAIIAHREALSTDTAAKELRKEAYAAEQATPHREASAMFTRVDISREEQLMLG